MSSDRSDAVAVVCRGLTKDFGQGPSRVRALRGVDLEIYAGQLTLVVGPSGCGKTTLLSVIAGILDPTEGQVSVLGNDVGRMLQARKTSFRRAHVGFVFQHYNLLPMLNAAENAAVPLIIAGWPRRAATKQAIGVLEKMGMERRAAARPSELSGGEQQRVAIARALVHEPQVIVCDEPTGALDGKTGQVMMSLLKQAAGESQRAVIVVTHDPRVFEFGDRVATMNDGRITAVGLPGDTPPESAGRAE